jgi:hypothetical protein
MRRQATACRIQKLRVALSRCERVKLSAARGCEKVVGLKSRPMSSDFAQSIHPLAAELAVERVQVEAVASRNQRKRHRGVGAQLIGRARLARVVAGRRQPSAEALAETLEAADVIPLPAVQRDRDAGEALQRRFSVDPEVGILLLRERISGFDGTIRHVARPSGARESVAACRRAPPAVKGNPDQVSRVAVQNDEVTPPRPPPRRGPCASAARPRQHRPRGRFSLCGRFSTSETLRGPRIAL